MKSFFSVGSEGLTHTQRIKTNRMAPTMANPIRRPERSLPSFLGASLFSCPGSSVIKRVLLYLRYRPDNCIIYAYSPECVEGGFSEVRRLRVLRGFARMPGREAGPRLGGGTHRTSGRTFFISHGHPSVYGLEVVDFPRLAEWGRSSATLPHSPLHAGIRTHSLCENMVNLG